MSAATVTEASRKSLRETVDHLAHLLPAQGPIGVFVHHNTLHAFQKHPFDEGVRLGGEGDDDQPRPRARRICRASSSNCYLVCPWAWM